MANPAPRLATYADVLGAPENQVAELIDGELSLQPRPALPHARATSSLGIEIGGPFDGGRGGPGGWWIVFEPELHLGADVLVPDVAGWRRERLPAIPHAPFLELAPDWLCEVVSPSTGRLDRMRKMPVYARSGVQNLWLLDPLARTLESYRLESGRWLLLATHGDDQCARIEPFEAIELEMKRLWT